MPLGTMGKCPGQIWLPAGVSKRMRQCCGRCLWVGLWPILNWKQCKPSWMGQLWVLPESREREPSHHQRWPTVGTGSAGHCWQVLVEMHVTNWAVAQKEDPELNAVLQWLVSKKKADLRTLLGECIMSDEGQMVWRNCQNFTSLRGTLYMYSTPKGENEDLFLFVVPKAHRTATLNGCHQDSGHQGHDCTLFQLQECFWWPGMTKQMRQVIKACRCCLQYEGGTPKAPLCPIVATAPLDLLHVDFTSIETMMELDKSPWVAKVLVFQDHFTKHVLAYVTPNQNCENPLLNFYMEAISLSLGLRPGSWVTEVLVLPVALLRNCVRSLASNDCRLCPTTPRLMGW